MFFKVKFMSRSSIAVVLHGSRWGESDSQAAAQQHFQPENETGRMEVRRNFFSVRVVDNWNKIPDRVRAVTMSEKFQQ